MKPRLLLAAGLCTGLLLLGTTLTADEPAADNLLQPALYGNGIGFPPHVIICHNVPGQKPSNHPQGKDRPQPNKVNEVDLSVCDFQDLCELPDSDDDRSEEAALFHDDALLYDDAAPAAAPEGINGCIGCREAAEAYAEEIEGHVNNHGDCWINAYVSGGDCDDVLFTEENGECNLL